MPRLAHCQSWAWWPGRVPSSKDLAFFVGWLGSQKKLQPDCLRLAASRAEGSDPKASPPPSAWHAGGGQGAHGSDARRDSERFLKKWLEETQPPVHRQVARVSVDVLRQRRDGNAVFRVRCRRPLRPFLKDCSAPISP